MSFLRRPFARLLAVPVLALWLAVALAPTVLAHEPDLECGEGAWTTDHHQTAFEDVRPPFHAGHCDLCHLQRALRGLSSESGRVIALHDSNSALVSPDPSLTAGPDRPFGPSRAPPSNLL